MHFQNRFLILEIAFDFFKGLVEQAYTVNAREWPEEGSTKPNRSTGERASFFKILWGEWKLNSLETGIIEASKFFIGIRDY